MIEAILSQYKIGTILEIKDIKKGSSSNAKYIKTSSGEYVLRELRSKNQAWMEYLIVNELFFREICPDIKMNSKRESFTVHEGRIFNLQTYIQEMPWPIEYAQLNNLGTTLSKFHYFFRK